MNPNDGECHLNSETGYNDRANEFVSDTLFWVVSTSNEGALDHDPDVPQVMILRYWRQNNETKQRVVLEDL